MAYADLLSDASWFPDGTPILGIFWKCQRRYNPLRTGKVSWGYFMPDYEIRLYRADSSLSIVMKTVANGMLEVQATAAAMLKGDIVRAEVWSEHRYIETLESIDHITSKFGPQSHSDPRS